MENTENNGGNIVTDAMNAMNAANRSGNELEKNYVDAAISALNTLMISDITPRMASKVARFRKVLQDYAKERNGGTQRVIEFDENGGAKDANGNDIADIYTV